jgi:uncharacterized protein
MTTRDTAWPAGTPCWIDYTADDVGAAQAFYADLLGWTYTDGLPEYGGYLTCLLTGRPAAGMAPKMDPRQPAGWTMYFASDDTDATCSAVTAAGGSVRTEPMQVGSLGRMALAVDTEGQTFGIWQAGEHTGVQVYNEPGALLWNEAAVADPERARAFYTAVFGFRFDPTPEVEGYTTFATTGDPLGGLGARAEGRPEGWGTCFAVASVKDALATVERAGGRTVMPVQDTPYGSFAVLADPWGATFSIMQRPA